MKDAGPPVPGTDATPTPAPAEYKSGSYPTYDGHARANGKARWHWTTAGVRALVRSDGSPSGVSRMHRITTETSGLVSVLGGKLTCKGVAEAFNLEYVPPEKAL